MNPAAVLLLTSALVVIFLNLGVAWALWRSHKREARRDRAMAEMYGIIRRHADRTVALIRLGETTLEAAMSALNETRQLQIYQDQTKRD